MGCPSGQRKIRFAINLDKWGEETTWEIKQLRTNDVVLRNSRTYTEYDEEVLDKCVDSGEPEEQYELSVYDEVVSFHSLLQIGLSYPSWRSLLIFSSCSYSFVQYMHRETGSAVNQVKDPTHSPSKNQEGSIA